jgi:orotidine-5'-phosphate decarboxylase
MTTSSPIILALDTQDISTAAQWITATRDSIDTYKVGLELFLKHGTTGLQQLRDVEDFDLFLDLKLHDIPNTVRAAVESVAELAPKFLTVHASGGARMVEAAASVSPSIEIVAVTILTSLSDDEIYEIGYREPALSSAVALAALGAKSGAQAIVSSPFEAQGIRNAVGPEITIITPGVRPAGSDANDQTRIMTPAQAIENGANYFVIGRPITSLSTVSLAAMGEKAAEILASVR